MKYLISAALVALAFWMWRKSTRAGREANRGLRGAQGPQHTSARPKQMLQCAHCHLHLDAANCVQDPKGLPYCSEPHRNLGPT